MRTKKGIVTSAKMQGTITVIVHRSVFHPIYKKRYRRNKKFLADTGDITDLQEGDTVVITECRPLSKRKCFRVTDVVDRVPRVSEAKEEEGLEKVLHREKKRTSDLGPRTSEEGPKSEVLSPKSETATPSET